MEEELWYSEKYQNCLRDMGLILSRLIPTLSRYERLVIKSMGFTPSQANLLLAVFNNPQRTMGEMARILGLDESTLTRNGSRLLGDGLLVRSQDPVDRRVYRLGLSEVGKEITQRVQGRIHQLYRKVIEKLPPGHVREVMAGVELLEEALGESLGEWSGE